MFTPVYSQSNSQPSPDDTSRASKMLQAIARASEELCVLKGWPEGLNPLAAELGKATGVSRVWVFQVIDLTDDCIDQDYILEWTSSPGFAQLHKDEFKMFRLSLDPPEYRAMVESHLRGDWQAIITRELPESWLRQHMEKQGILSMLTVPIHVEGKWWGTIGFDDCQREYRWTNDEIALLRTASSILSNSISRERLNSDFQQYSILQEVPDSAAWSLNLKNGRLRCSGGLIQSAIPRSQYRLFRARDLLRMAHPDDRKILFKSLRQFFSSGEHLFRHDLRLRDDRGRFRWIEIVGQLARDEANRPKKLSGIAIDIRTRKKVELDLRDRAHIDPLTGAANRWMFDEQLKRLMRDAQDSGKFFSLLLFDLDHFKQVNDTYGHLVGDRVLQAITDICRENLRVIDLLARLGGEEFALLLPGVGPRESAIIAERIRIGVAAKPVVPGIMVTVSFGAVTYDPARPVSPKTLFNRADEALYTAKHQGRNRLVMASSIV